MANYKSDYIRFQLTFFHLHSRPLFLVICANNVTLIMQYCLLFFLSRNNRYSLQLHPIFSSNSNSNIIRAQSTPFIVPKKILFDIGNIVLLYCILQAPNFLSIIGYWSDKLIDLFTMARDLGWILNFISAPVRLKFDRFHTRFDLINTQNATNSNKKKVKK